MENVQDSPERRSETRPDAEELHQAALLIDFDNVTMGIRSNLGQELRNLLNSDVIRGKVAVQRAYADWRRYPQYIVPLSEASIDLIFAPAYGSSKKNATDIRLAIDALELVFIRPEIKTFILMSGDSDFSSLVLKLKEYGKYVIGVGIQESSSDLLVQNCDEYYSYSALSGLTKSGEQPVERHDPWVLVEKAIRKMVERGDTMRSDRLKQVMLEMDPSFNEKEQGFSKFNRFVVEAASQGLLSIQKMENGQYGVAPGDRVGAGVVEASGPSPEKRVARTPARRGSARRGKGRAREREAKETRAQDGARTRRARPKLTMESALELLDRALGVLLGGRADSVRDSDVKRRMLEIDSDFDEGELGFSKFSKFLQAAEEAGAVSLSKGPNGNYRVAQRTGRPSAGGVAKGRESSPSPEGSRSETTMKRLARFLFGGAKEEEAGLSAEAPARPRPERRPAGREPATPRQRRGRGRAERGVPAPRARKSGAAGGGRSSGDEAPSARTEAAGQDVRAGRDRRKPRRGPREAPRGSLEAPRGSPEAPRRSPDVADEVRGRDVAPEPPTTPAAGERGAASVDTPPGQAGAAPVAGQTATVTPAPLPGAPRGTIRGRWGTRGRYRPAVAPPPIYEGQTAPGGEAGAGGAGSGGGGAGSGDLVSYLKTRYAGVGAKTAETLVEAFGEDVFRVLDEEPERVRAILPGRRGERVLEARREEREAGGK